jgi:hypothetical protein
MTASTRPYSIIAAFCLGMALLPLPATADPEVKLHPIEKYTIAYEFEGMQSGSSTQYNRDWGHLRAEVQDTTTSMMGVTIANKQRMIVKDAEIITIDLKTNTATTTKNPMYDRLVASLRDRNLTSEQLGEEMLRAMGGAPTGESGSFAGESCDWWAVQQVGQRLCITDDALTLRMEMNLGGMKMVQTATAVRRGDGGPDDAFDYSNIPVQKAPDMPDLSELLGKMPQQPDAAAE